MAIHVEELEKVVGDGQVSSRVDPQTKVLVMDPAINAQRLRSDPTRMDSMHSNEDI